MLSCRDPVPLRAGPPPSVAGNKRNGSKMPVATSNDLVSISFRRVLARSTPVSGGASASLLVRSVPKYRGGEFSNSIMIVAFSSLFLMSAKNVFRRSLNFRNG